MFEKNMKLPILLDAYGSLLTGRKAEVLDLYYNEDMSLSEISEITGISRQGVRDSVKKGEGELLEFEGKLGVVGKREECDRLIGEALAAADKLPDSDCKEEIKRILEVIAAMP